MITETLEKGTTVFVLEGGKIESKTRELSSSNNVAHTGRIIGNASLHSQALVAEDGFQIQVSGATTQRYQVSLESGLECRSSSLASCSGN
jgi:hypothetical protein